MMKVDNVNQLMVTLANELNVQFINNDQNFRYQDNSIDETLLLPGDGLHLSPQGVKKLLQNLGLDDRAKSNFGNGPTNRWKHTKDQKKETHQKHNMDQQKQQDSTAPSAAPPPPQRPGRSKANVDKSQTFYFRGGENPCSNFYHVRKGLPIYGEHFHWSEQAYQYRKAVEVGDWQAADDILQAKSAKEAKDMGNKVDVSNSDWHNIKERIMYEILSLKIKQCSELRMLLIASGDKELVERTNNPFWADGPDGKGLNTLGKLLMTLRTQVIQNDVNVNMSSTYSRPACFNCGETI